MHAAKCLEICAWILPQSAHYGSALFKETSPYLQSVPHRGWIPDAAQVYTSWSKGHCRQQGLLLPSGTPLHTSAPSTRTGLGMLEKTELPVEMLPI